VWRGQSQEWPYEFVEKSPKMQSNYLFSNFFA
jgi:hypothetical protein